MSYILHLLPAPNQEMHSMQLLTADSGQREQPALGSAGEQLDADAISAYKLRREDIEDRLAQADRNQDQAQKELAHAELELLEKEVVAAIGLGGKHRNARDDSERVRKNVSNAITRAIESIQEHHPTLGIFLDLHLKRGLFVCYSDDGIPWNF
jgi:hypothetical protein